MPPAECERAHAAMARGGAVTVALSRPVPIVAETVAIIAGATGMPLHKLVAATAIGSLPPAVAYGLAGAVTASSGAGLYVFAGVIALTALMWTGERAVTRPGPRLVTLDGPADTPVRCGKQRFLKRP